jgi:hypothetical protein
MSRSDKVADDLIKSFDRRMPQTRNEAAWQSHIMQQILAMSL